MFGGLVLVGIAMAAWFLWGSSLRNPTGRLIVGVLAVVLGFWGVLSILSSGTFWVLAIVAAVGYGLYRLTGRGKSRRALNRSQGNSSLLDQALGRTRQWNRRR